MESLDEISVTIMLHKLAFVRVLLELVRSTEELSATASELVRLAEWRIIQRKLCLWDIFYHDAFSHSTALIIHELIKILQILTFWLDHVIIS